MKRSFISALCATAAISILHTTAFAQSPTREELLNDIQTRRAELQKLEQQFLAPAEEDFTAYAEFLRQPDTGLIRLLPRETYDTEVYRNRKKSLTLRGGGAYYSFSRRVQEYGFGSDISLDSNYLSVGFAGADYGMLVSLGDVPLQEISIEYPGAGFIASYSAAAEEPQARVEQRRFSNGISVDGFNYKNRLPVAVNTTYLLRSIYYSESDVLVALRVVRKDTDDSVIITWKMLKKYSKPALARTN